MIILTINGPLTTRIISLCMYEPSPNLIQYIYRFVEGGGKAQAKSLGPAMKWHYGEEFPSGPFVYHP